MGRKRAKTAKQRLIDSANIKIANRSKKLRRLELEFNEQRAEIQREIDDQIEVLKALGAKPPEIGASKPQYARR